MGPCLHEYVFIENSVDFNENSTTVLHLHNFDVSEIYEGNVQSYCYLAQLFLDTLVVILRKSEIVGEFFSPALEMQFGRFY